MLEKTADAGRRNNGPESHMPHHSDLILATSQTYYRWCKPPKAKHGKAIELWNNVKEAQEVVKQTGCSDQYLKEGGDLNGWRVRCGYDPGKQFEGYDGFRNKGESAKASSVGKCMDPAANDYTQLADGAKSHDNFAKFATKCPQKSKLRTQETQTLQDIALGETTGFGGTAMKKARERSQKRDAKRLKALKQGAKTVIKKVTKTAKAVTKTAVGGVKKALIPLLRKLVGMVPIAAGAKKVLRHIVERAAGGEQILEILKPPKEHKPSLTPKQIRKKACNNPDGCAVEFFQVGHFLRLYSSYGFSCRSYSLT